MKRVVKFARSLGMPIALLLAGQASAAAPETGDWLVRAGASTVAPQSDNGTLHLDRAIPAPPSKIEVDDSTSFTLTVSYFLTPNVAVELLAAYPFSHDFTLEDINLDGSVDHLPPTLSLQYHYPINDTFKPYAGIGVNYTIFSNAHVEAPVNVNIDNSVGLAGQVGLDVALNEHWLVNVDVRYMEIGGDVDVNNVDVGNVDVNPWIYGLNVGYRF